MAKYFYSGVVVVKETRQVAMWFHGSAEGRDVDAIMRKLEDLHEKEAAEQEGIHRHQLFAHIQQFNGV